MHILIAFHGGVSLDNGGTNEISVWIKFGRRDISSVKNNISAILFGGCNKSGHSLFRSRRYERSSWGESQ